MQSWLSMPYTLQRYLLYGLITAPSILLKIVLKILSCLPCPGLVEPAYCLLGLRHWLCWFFQLRGSGNYLLWVIPTNPRFLLSEEKMVLLLKETELG